MDTTIFQQIFSSPDAFFQALAFVGLSAGTISGIARGFKAFINWIKRVRNKAKKIAILGENTVVIAKSIVQKLKDIGQPNEIVELAQTFATLIDSQIGFSNQIKEFKEMLQSIVSFIATLKNAPLELIAYIETVLKDTGNENLYLKYEQSKNALIEAKAQTEASIVNFKSDAEQTINEIKDIASDLKESTTKAVAEVTDKIKKIRIKK